MFVQATPSSPINVREKYYRQHYHGNPQYEKSYKHCSLSETITPPISLEICECEGISQVDEKRESHTCFQLPMVNHTLITTKPDANCSIWVNRWPLQSIMAYLTVLKSKQNQPKGCKNLDCKLRSILSLDPRDQNGEDNESIEI